MNKMLDDFDAEVKNDFHVSFYHHAEQKIQFSVKTYYLAFSY